jgi:uncharacterized protein (DUF302 family)
METREMTQQPSYGLTRHLEGVPFGEARTRTIAALATEGFGVLTEIDVRATLRKKLDVDVPEQVILGACNPNLAHRALEAEPWLGLLLPCNVVVRTDGRGGANVSAVSPRAMFRIVGNPEIEPVAAQVEAMIQRVLDRI